MNFWKDEQPEKSIETATPVFLNIASNVPAMGMNLHSEEFVSVVTFGRDETFNSPSMFFSGSFNKRQSLGRRGGDELLK